MALAWTSLAAGQLPNAKATLYTAAGQVAIKNITLVTTDTAAHTVNIYIKLAAGTSKRIIPANLPMDGDDPDAAAQVECIGDNAVELAVGDTIEGDADTASVIDYTITGATR